MYPLIFLVYINENYAIDLGPSIDCYNPPTLDVFSLILSIDIDL